MQQEHSSEEEFTTDNYALTTYPAEEWRTVMECDKSKEINHRKVPNVADLLETEKTQPNTSNMARLTKEEIIAIVLYTGPMVCISQYRAIRLSAFLF